MIVKVAVQVHEVSDDAAMIAERMVREALDYYPYNELGHGRRVTFMTVVDDGHEPLPAEYREEHIAASEPGILPFPPQ